MFNRRHLRFNKILAGRCTTRTSDGVIVESSTQRDLARAVLDHDPRHGQRGLSDGHRGIEKIRGVAHPGPVVRAGVRVDRFARSPRQRLMKIPQQPLIDLRELMGANAGIRTVAAGEKFRSAKCLPKSPNPFTKNRLRSIIFTGCTTGGDIRSDSSLVLGFRVKNCRNPNPQPSVIEALTRFGGVAQLVRAAES
jgi:hypothetical protein